MSKRILVVEDDEPFLECFSTILRSNGFTPVPVSKFSGPEDLMTMMPDCIILDEFLPDLKGHTICTVLKRFFPVSQIPIILMSGIGDLKERADLCCADGMIAKPFPSNDIVIKEIRSLIEHQSKKRINKSDAVS